MASHPVNLLNHYDLQDDPYLDSKIDSSQVINYCEARFRAALPYIMAESAHPWMERALRQELVRLSFLVFLYSYRVPLQQYCLAIVGTATAIGQSVEIPIIIRSLAHNFFPVHSRLNSLLFCHDIIVYLDGGLPGSDSDDPGLRVSDFHLPWWLTPDTPTPKASQYLNHSTIDAVLAFHLDQIKSLPVLPVGARARTRASNPIPDFKRTFVWHPSVEDNPPDLPCTRCRLYRSVAFRAAERLRQFRNTADALRSANHGEAQLIQRSASAANLLFEQAIIKEAQREHVDRWSYGIEPVRSPGLSVTDMDLYDEYIKKRKKIAKMKKKPTGIEQAEEVRILAKRLAFRWLDSPAQRWICGVEVTDEDLTHLVRAVDRNYQVPHSGYDESLRSGAINGRDSPNPDPASLDVNMPVAPLSKDFPTVRDLEPHEIPLAFAFPPLHYLSRAFSSPDASNAAAAQNPDPDTESSSFRGKKRARDSDSDPASDSARIPAKLKGKQRERDDPAEQDPPAVHWHTHDPDMSMFPYGLIRLPSVEPPFLRDLPRPISPLLSHDHPPPSHFNSQIAMTSGSAPVDIIDIASDDEDTNMNDAMVISDHEAKSPSDVMDIAEDQGSRPFALPFVPIAISESESESDSESESIEVQPIAPPVALPFVPIDISDSEEEVDDEDEDVEEEVGMADHQTNHGQPTSNLNRRSHPYTTASFSQFQDEWVE
jgi:hypothetical protein